MDHELQNKTNLPSIDENQEEDRLSRMPDELIHQILKFVDTKLAVQTSVLSKRWKLVWTTLPFINLYVRSTTDINLIHHLLAHRNHGSGLLKLDLFFRISPCLSLANKVINYAISHRLRKLYVDLSWYDYEDDGFELMSFSSSTLKELALCFNYPYTFVLSDCWDLPVLTTLRLIRPCAPYIDLPESYLISLPSLQTLSLFGFELPRFICLPTLTTLILQHVRFTCGTSEFFNALVNLRNLTIHIDADLYVEFVINCPQLVNLRIKCSTGAMIIDSAKNCKAIVLAPKIRNFSSVGFCQITFGAAKLENVNIKLDNARFELSKKFHHLVTNMFWGLSSARILTLDLKTIEALSAISKFLVFDPPPFYNLEFVKVPCGYNESSMPTNLKSYLLSCSPKAAIVTTLPQKTMTPHKEAVSLTAETMVLQKPLAAPTKVCVSSKNMHKTMYANTLDMGVQEEHLVQNSVVNEERVMQISLPAQGAGNNRVSSSWVDSDVGLWQGHVVNSEFVCLLDLIMNKYPETFELFTTTNKLSTMKLNMLCNFVSVFTKISMTQVDAEMIAEHRVVFDALQKLGFNVSWLVNRMNYIEQLRFSQPLLSELHAIDYQIDNVESKLQDLQIRTDDTKTELQDLRTLHAEKMQQIQKAFGTMGTDLVVGNIGDDLLSGP